MRRNPQQIEIGPELFWTKVLLRGSNTSDCASWWAHRGGGGVSFSNGLWLELDSGSGLSSDELFMLK